MKKSILIIFSLAFISFSATAQTYTQKGTVRMITYSESSPLVPVQGARVVVGNVMSGSTTENGAFSISVPNTFQVNAVTPSSEYILTIPTAGKTFSYSKNDLDVVVTTKKRQEEDYRRLYTDIRRQYDRQSDEIIALKRQYARQLEELDKADKEYSKVKAQYDSLQTLYLDYINNETKIDKEIRRVAKELSITDYQTLDTLSQRIYILKTQGQWKSITDLLEEVMHGDAAKFLQEKIANRDNAAKMLHEADSSLAASYRNIGKVYFSLGDSVEALDYLNKSMAVFSRIFPENHPEILAIKNDIESIKQVQDEQ